VLLLGTLVMALPHARRFFLSERWGGYGQAIWDVDILQNPVAMPGVLAVWSSCAVLLIIGRWTVWAALVSLILCRYFFVRMRWKGVLRGMGAPGFMTYWLAGAVFLLEYSAEYAQDLKPLALLVTQVDLSLIMLSSGVYKLSAGYPRNQGMELGMVNPEWGYWWRQYRERSPRHWLFKILNQLAWSTEVVIAVTGLVPATRQIAAVLLVVSFLFIATQIRLGVLCEAVMVAALVFIESGSTLDRAISGFVGTSIQAANPDIAIPGVLNLALAAWMGSYLLLLPLAHGGILYNFYARKVLPRLLQGALEAYTNFYGIIIWRVFSVDITNFFIRIYQQSRTTGERSLVSNWGPGGGLRYGHVGESIAVTTLFTTLKYYPSNSEIFADRVLRYASTVPCPTDSVLIFEYVSVTKQPDTFRFVPAAEFVVDVSKRAITEQPLSDAVSLREAHVVSPVFEGGRPGSYVPLDG